MTTTHVQTPVGRRDGRRHPTTEAAVHWPCWGTTAHVVVTDATRCDEARTLVEQRLAAVDAAASRFRADAEICRLHLAGGRPQRVSALLADLVRVALDAARATEGDVDPTVGAAMSALGYDRDHALLPRSPSGQEATRSGVRAVPVPAPGWQRVRLDGTTLTVPPDVVLDLGATAKAYTADLAAADVATSLGTGVLVSLGGDIATAGPAPQGGWRVLVQDRPGDPAQTVTLPGGAAVATSSTRSRQWYQDGRLLHHLLDPRRGQPAEPVWRSATVAAWRCLDANTLSTAALVRGIGAASWLRERDVPARLVTAAGEVVATPRWPTTRPLTTPASAGGSR